MGIDGDPETASSTRSEWFGYAGMIVAMLMLDTLIATSLTHPQQQIHI